MPSKATVNWRFSIVVRFHFIVNINSLIYIVAFFKLGFSTCKAEEPLQGMELQEKKVQKD